MKYLLPIIFLLAGFMPVQAQVHTHNKEWHTKKVERVHPGLYKVEYAPTPYVTMKGRLAVHRKNMVRDGIWTVYRHGRPVQKIKYVNGTRVWIELENGHRVTRQQIELRNLQRRVRELERQLSQIN